MVLWHQFMSRKGQIIPYLFVYNELQLTLHELVDAMNCPLGMNRAHSGACDPPDFACGKITPL